MPQLSFVVTDSPDEDAVRALILPLNQFNEAQVGPSAYRPLAVLLKDQEQHILGGMWGTTSYGWLFIQLLIVSQHLRGRGIGTRLMRLAEQEAQTRHCHGAWLDTHDFQARPFYEHLGYTCFGELPDFPRGHARYFMKKALDGAAQQIPPGAD